MLEGGNHKHSSSNIKSDHLQSFVLVTEFALSIPIIHEHYIELCFMHHVREIMELRTCIIKKLAWRFQILQMPQVNVYTLKLSF